MRTLLDQALESVRRLDPATQDEIARVMKLLAGDEESPPVPLTPEERAAIARSKAETARGEYPQMNTCARSGPSTGYEAPLLSLRTRRSRSYPRLY
jgi:hypothetical protein